MEHRGYIERSVTFMATLIVKGILGVQKAVGAIVAPL